MKITSVSENSIIIFFQQVISQDNLALVTAVTQHIKEQLNDVIVDIIPSYASIHITFNTAYISHTDFKKKLSEIPCTRDDNARISAHKKRIEIPVYYGKEVALDLEWLASRANISEKQVIAIHSSKVYDVYAIGFTPGFAYLGDIDKRISFPRKQTPRKKVAKGSVAIANQQTAIYPADSPGGWQIIGKTPLQLIDYHSKNLTQFVVGDTVKFTPISQAEYRRMGGIL